MTKRQKLVLVWIATAVSAAAVIFSVIGIAQVIIESINN